MLRQIPILATIIAMPRIFSDRWAYMVQVTWPWFVFLLLISATGCY